MFDSLCNFRDVADVAQALRPGRLYRSDLLGRLAPDDAPAFAALGVRTVIDLRYDWEIASDGRYWPDDDGVAWWNLSIEHRPYDQAALAADVDVVAYLGDRHLEVLQDGVAELRQVLEVLASGAPAVLHCTSGKDRTGLVVALVLSLLDVPDAEIVHDFALTGRATPRLRAAWSARHGGAEPTWDGYGTAPPALMERLLADVRERYGSFAGYAREELGAEASLIDALRAEYLREV